MTRLSDRPFDTSTLPYGIFSTEGSRPRVGVATGDRILDLTVALGDEVFDRLTLNDFMASGRAAWESARSRIKAVLDASGDSDMAKALVPRAAATLHLPFAPGDFVDFFSSLEHATNTGRMFRPDQDPLKANWKELPVGYHGRAGTVVVSGTDVVRPCGQLATAGRPRLAPSERLDIEVELGVVVGKPSSLGDRVSVADFAEHAFGMVILIDWSARDIQAWEYQPLGPFLSKSFATTISPWVVPMTALEPAAVDGPAQDPQPLEYLRQEEPRNYDIELEFLINSTTVSRPQFSSMYWSPAQQLAHMTVNGASLRTGDLYGSGTISSFDAAGQGSLLELSWNGAHPVKLDDGSQRSFLLDNDVVTVRATARGRDGQRIDFGEASGRVLPATDAE